MGFNRISSHPGVIRKKTEPSAAPLNVSVQNQFMDKTKSQKLLAAQIFRGK